MDAANMAAEELAGGNASQANCSTLYFGNLHPYVAQKGLEDLCAYFGEVEQAKVIKDKTTGTSAGYGFVRFVDRKAAEMALQALNGKAYLGHELRVNWALPSNHKEDTSQHQHIFVGDLGSEVTDAMLYNAFCTALGQCSDARVMWDHATGRSKGYGFVSFRTKDEAEAALAKMQGRQIGSRKIRCGWAQHKQDDAAGPPEFDNIDKADPSNTNVYVGNTSPEWSEGDVAGHFSLYGPVAEVKLHKKGGYGFVKFEHHESAVKAIVDMHGKELFGRVLKCAWGKNIVAPASSLPTTATTTSVFGHLTGARGLAALSAAANMSSMAGAGVAGLMPGLGLANGGLSIMGGVNGVGGLVGGVNGLMGGMGGLVGGMNGFGAGLLAPQGMMGLSSQPAMVMATGHGNSPALSQMIPMALATQMMMMGQPQAGASSLQANGLGHGTPASAGPLALDPHSLYAYQNAGMYGGVGYGGNAGFVNYVAQYK